MNPEQWLSLKWNGGSTMSDRWLNQSKIIHMFSDSSADTRCSDDNNIDKTNVDIIHIDNTFLIICFINSYLHLSISYLQLTISYEIFNFLSIVFCIY